jgi:hypothetical protein
MRRKRKHLDNVILERETGENYELGTRYFLTLFFLSTSCLAQARSVGSGGRGTF